MREQIPKDEIISSVKRTPKSYLVWKRGLDILLSLFGITVLSPAFLATALVIMVYDGKGRPLFVQTRVGKDGKTFRMLKFRTMRPGAEKEYDKLVAVEENDEIAYKIRHDPRITKPGRWLRKTGIDELPQLFNVLKGDMSLVGPRPPLPAEVALYNDYQKCRLLIKPGITCLWQVTPARNDVPFDEWLQLDFRYMKERSLMLDLRIILQTFGVIFPGEGI